MSNLNFKKFASDNHTTEDKIQMQLQEEFNSEGTSMKFASTVGTALIRENLYEASFARAISPFEYMDPKTDKRLVPQFNSEYPVAMIHREPSTAPAMTLPFDANVPQQFFYGTKSPLTFFRISTPELQKSQVTIDTYPYDIVKTMYDNSLKNIAKQEDYCWYLISADAVAESGNYYTISTGWSRAVLAQISNVFINDQMPHGTNLINKATYNSITAMIDRNNGGGDIAQDVFLNGADALNGKSVGGMKWISTLKNDIIPNNEIIAYTERDRLGVNAELYRPTMYMKKEKSRISCSAEETIGFCISTTRGVARIVLSSAVLLPTAASVVAPVTSYPQVKPVTKIS